ncbi:hypothetical protein V5F53_20675 [Xanthobacter sp. V4C-4]|uniref:hypothetical protein n=1 Tax=Xanthobacter cornucopiae TaxID=3119924 RepID=UPI0037297DF0
MIIKVPRERRGGEAMPVEPIERPDIVIPDTGPLIHLSQVDALPLLHEIGGAVVIVDVVRYELTTDMTKPEAERIQQWIERGLEPGSNMPVRLELTETGEALRLARLVKPDFRMRNGGEVAMVEWLAEKVSGTDRTALVLYENGKVPKLIADQDLHADIDVVTTRAFLALAERRGLIPSAEALWRRIVESSPTTNDTIRSFSQRRPPGGDGPGM